MWVLGVLVAVLVVGSGLLAWRDRHRSRPPGRHGQVHPGEGEGRAQQLMGELTRNTRGGY